VLLDQKIENIKNKDDFLLQWDEVMLTMPLLCMLHHNFFVGRLVWAKDQMWKSYLASTKQ
jgi:hypothetical protein